MPADARSGPSKRVTARQRIAEKRAAEAAARARADRRRRTVIGAVTAVVLLALAVIITVAVQGQRTTTSANAAVPAHTIDHGTVIPVGQSTAPVTVDLYEDLQCPNCKAFEDQSGATLAGLVAAGTVQLHYHPMAFLDSSANQNYSTRALNAAGAVLNAAGPDAYQKFHALLYAHQPPESGPGLTDDQLIHYAGQAGATGSPVADQIRNLTYRDWTRRVTDQASTNGVTGTPTVIVAGKQLTDLSPNGIASAVQAAHSG